MPVRAGWVPCVGFQPPMPMMVFINEADVIAEECERAFRQIRHEDVPRPAPAAPPAPPLPLHRSGTEGQEDDSPPQAPTKPAMKLLMNPKGVQDFQAVQQHYQVLMDSAVPTSPEVGKIVTEYQSPTGKGAELFAKRKKRMDKFIVDETTVQKAQQQTTMVMQQTLSSSSSTSTSSSTFTAKKQAEMERNKQQEQILLANTVCGRADSKAESWLEMPKAVPLDAPPINPAHSGPVDFYTAEVKVVQRASHPATPVAEIPLHTLVDFASDTKEDKRRSASFNMAAKGWGTYNNFYTPVTFATSS